MGGEGGEAGEPAEFAAAHGAAVGGGCIVVAGQVVDAVGEVEGELGGGAAGAALAVFEGALEVDDELGGGAGESGDGKVGLGDDVGLEAYAEGGGLVAGHGVVVDEEDGEGVEGAGGWGVRKRQAGQPPGEAPECRNPWRAHLLEVAEEDFHWGRDSFRGGCW